MLEFSTLTIQPWPMVEPNEKFNITGTLVDKITLQSIPSSDISFLYESASEEIQPSSLNQIDNQNTMLRENLVQLQMRLVLKV
jgi:hypothetical protein